MAQKKRKPTQTSEARKKKSPAKTKSRKKAATRKSAMRTVSRDVFDPYEEDFLEKLMNKYSGTLTEEEQSLLQLHGTLKLQVELVPGSSFWKNVRKMVTRTEWDKIRRAVYQKADNSCEVCGGKGTKHAVECHEVWIYEDATLTQRLGFFQAICPLCHEVKHIGWAGVRGNKARAVARFREINGLSEDTADTILAAVWKQWHIRSDQQWTQDIEHLREHGFNPQELKDRNARNLVTPDKEESW